MRLTAALVSITLAAACATIPPTATSIIRLDMSSGRPVIEARMKDGSNERFIFDTGAQTTSVTQALADRLALPVVGRVLLGSPAGGQPVDTALVDLGPIKVGTVSTSSQPASILDWMPPPQPGSQTINGVLAPTSLSSGLVEIDVAAATVRLADTPSRNGVSWQPLSPRGLPIGEMSLGGVRFPVYVDTGNPRDFLLPLRLLKQLAPDAELVEVGRIGLVDMSVPRFEVELNMDATIAGQTIRLGKVSVADLPPQMANLGVSQLKDFTVAINTRDRTWALWRSERR